MKMHVLFIKHFPLFHFLWILIHMLSSASCASLEKANYSSEPFNASGYQSNFSNPTNLSELIEYSPVSLEDDLRDWEQRIKDAKIIKVRLRTSLTVGNHESENETAVFDKIDGTLHPNASETPLSEIEFQDKFSDFLVWKAFGKRVARMIPVDNETDMLFDSDDELKNSEEDSSNAINLTSRVSNERQTGRSIQLSKYARGSQFLFPPYMPTSPFTYDKDTPQDEKISFHDVLPVKAVKFIKSMVEDADWNGMFKSMVRTVVDHFVNKIIEKMFSEKDDHLKKRSLDGLVSSSIEFPSLQNLLVRLKRATKTNNPTDQIKDIFNMPSKRAHQELDAGMKKTAQEKMSWFDQFLDYVFPNQNPDKYDYDSSHDRLKKRDTANSDFLKVIFELFLNTFEKSSEFLKDAKDVIRLKMLKEFSPYFHKYGHSNSSSNYVDAMKMSHRKTEKNIPHLYDVANYVSARSVRKRRSTREYFRKMEDRLWQFHPHRHRPHSYSSREDCSLRKACNAGRLLARFPSIQDIALQLRGNGNEPHWDALLWGMKKKGCSRIFCKRRRSPKGSKKEKELLTKRILIVTDPPETFSETDNLTV